MNTLFHPTLILSLLRQRAQSPARVLLIAALWGLPLALIAVTRGAPGLQPLSLGAVFAFVLGAGVIGGEASAGVFQLLFARPVTRPAYVLSRWLGVALAAATLAAAQIAVGALLLTAFHAPFEWSAAGVQALEQALDAIGTASVIVMFSSFLPGVGDVFAVFAAVAFAVTVNGAGQLMQKPWLARAGDELHKFFGPQFSWATAFDGSAPSWFHITSYLSTVAVCLTLAIVMMNRREISYASE